MLTSHTSHYTAVNHNDARKVCPPGFQALSPSLTSSPPYASQLPLTFPPARLSSETLHTNRDTIELVKDQPYVGGARSPLAPIAVSFPRRSVRAS